MANRPENTPEVIDRARVFVLEKPSTSYVQRKMQIGYNLAADLMEHFEQEGIISPPKSDGTRTVLNGAAEVMRLRGALKTIADKGQSGEWTLPSSFYNHAICALRGGN